MYMKEQRPLLWLCLLLLLLSACAQVSVGQAGQASKNNPGAAQQQKTRLTYVAIGASETFGTGADDPYRQNWPTDLAALLGSNHVHLINLGVPGILIHDALSMELPIALDSHPDLVTVWLGVNDITSNVDPTSYARDLSTLISRLQANNPRARIAIANIPDLALLPAFSNADQQALLQQVQAYNDVIASVAQRYHLILVDFTTQNYNLKAHPEYISDDGLHPTESGYQQVAKLFYAALQRTSG